MVPINVRRAQIDEVQDRLCQLLFDAEIRSQPSQEFLASLEADYRHSPFGLPVWFPGSVFGPENIVAHTRPFQDGGQMVQTSHIRARDDDLRLDLTPLRSCSFHESDIALSVEEPCHPSTLDVRYGLSLLIVRLSYHVSPNQSGKALGSSQHLSRILDVRIPFQTSAVVLSTTFRFCFPVR